MDNEYNRHKKRFIVFLGAVQSKLTDNATNFIIQSVENDNWDEVELTIKSFIEKQYSRDLDSLIASIPRNIKSIQYPNLK